MPHTPDPLGSARSLNQAVSDHHYAVEQFQRSYSLLFPAQAGAPVEPHRPRMEEWLAGPPAGVEAGPAAAAHQAAAQHHASRDAFGRHSYEIALLAAGRYLAGKFHRLQAVRGYRPGDESEQAALGTEYDFANEAAAILIRRLCENKLAPGLNDESRLRYIWVVVRNSIVKHLEKTSQPALDPVLGDLWVEFQERLAASAQLPASWAGLCAALDSVPDVRAAWAGFVRLATTWGDPHAFRRWQAGRPARRQASDPGSLRRRWRELQTAVRRAPAVAGPWQTWQQAAGEAGRLGDPAALAWQEFVRSLRGTPLVELDRPLSPEDGGPTLLDEARAAAPDDKPGDDELEQANGRVRAYFDRRPAELLTHFRRCYTLLRLAGGAEEGEIAAEYLALDRGGLPLRRGRRREDDRREPAPYNPVISQDQAQWDAGVRAFVGLLPLQARAQLLPRAWQAIYPALLAGPGGAGDGRPGALLAWLWDLCLPGGQDERARLHAASRPGRRALVRLGGAGREAGWALSVEVTWAGLVPELAELVAGRRMGPAVEVIRVYDIAVV